MKSPSKQRYLNLPNPTPSDLLVYLVWNVLLTLLSISCFFSQLASFAVISQNHYSAPPNIMIIDISQATSATLGGFTHLHIYTFTHLTFNIYTITHLYIYTFTHLYIYTFTHSHIYTFTHVHIYIFTHLHIYTFTHLHIYTFTHLHIYTFTHLHIYIYRPLYRPKF